MPSAWEMFRGADVAQLRETDDGRDRSAFVERDRGPANLLDHFGPFVALFAFFALMPLGHMTIGVLLVVLGLFYPILPEEHEKHEVRIGSGTAKGLSGNYRISF